MRMMKRRLILLQRDKECVRCGGKGYHDYGAGNRELLKDCPICKGEGRVKINLQKNQK